MTELLRELEAVVGLSDAAKHAALTLSAEEWESARDALNDSAVNFIRTHHAEIAEALKLARGDREEAWEVWQDDMCVAGSTDASDAEHYLMMYGQDGPAKLVRVVSYRETVTQQQLDAHNSAREVGE